jgi:hypothetical protein
MLRQRWVYGRFTRGYSALRIEGKGNGLGRESLRQQYRVYNIMVNPTESFRENGTCERSCAMGRDGQAWVPNIAPSPAGKASTVTLES